MVYELYTWVNCDDCNQVKSFLKEKNISYDEINLFNNPEGRKTFGKVYTQLDGKLKRNLRSGNPELPILVDLEYEGDRKKVRRFAQRYSGIKDLLE